jgi:hypothetical protein
MTALELFDSQFLVLVGNAMLDAMPSDQASGATIGEVVKDAERTIRQQVDKMTVEQFRIALAKIQIKSPVPQQTKTSQTIKLPVNNPEQSKGKL